MPLSTEANIPDNTVPDISTPIPNNETEDTKSTIWVLAKNTLDSFQYNNDTVDDEMQQRAMQVLFDKKRKRRESHNAVERRRRDNINERIMELSTLLPDATKDNEGTILQKSVDHIKLLHDSVHQYQQRIQELENMLNIYRMRWGDLQL